MKNTNKHLISIINNLISRESEEEWFEFKENWYEPVELGQYISALSNAAAMKGEDNAYLVWGIDNSSHKVKGTTFKYQIDVKGEPLQHFLARKLSPDVGFAFEEIVLNSERVVVLVIPSAEKVPVAFDGIRYIRIGSSKENLMKYPERESMLFNILRNGYPSVTNTESAYQDLSFNKLFMYYEAKGVPLNKKTFKKNLGFVTPDGKYNLLAQLLSDDSHFTIRFALFTGKDKASKMYSVREFGNTCLLYSLDDVLRYGDVLNIPQADERNRIVERKEVPLFNARAYSEAVINAFVHNKWVDDNGPMFTGFSDRIEILSRGTLPPKQTVEGFYAGESVPVNEALSKIFIQLHITEHTGRGIPQITSVYGKENIKIKENNIVVTIPYEKLENATETTTGTMDAPVNVPVEVPNVPVDVPVEDEDMLIEDKILVFCYEAKRIAEIAEHLGYKDKRTIRKYINPLIEQGRLSMTIPDKPNSKNQKYVSIK